MTHKTATKVRGDMVFQSSQTSWSGAIFGAQVAKMAMSLFLLFVFVVLVPGLGYAAPKTPKPSPPVHGYERPTYPIAADVYTTREQTVRPDALDPGTPQLTIDDVEQFAETGYSAYTLGPGEDAGRQSLRGTPEDEYDPQHSETLLTFFSMTDIHVSDKESPAQAFYTGVTGSFGHENTSSDSPVTISTTQVLDAAVQTINALHTRMPFDFGISLGDDVNNTQYNELRWFIDVMDGGKITPSTGNHRGARFIDYQMTYYAAGLDKSIPWYQTIGNHDQFWMGTLFIDDNASKAYVARTVMDICFVGDALFPQFVTESTCHDNDGLPLASFYVGVVDGSTEYGDVVGYGDTSTMATPIIVADQKRRTLSTQTSTSLNWMKEFFNTTSEPRGHGFTQANLDNDFASYTFEPKANVPIKVIVLDDTCKKNNFDVFSSYARACLDQDRYDWLENELEQGQADGKLMIIAAHIPVGPYLDIPDALPVYDPDGTLIPNDTPIPLFLSMCKKEFPNCKEGDPLDYFTPIDTKDSVVSDATLLELLHEYPNLILWVSGHRHINAVTPQPAPEGKAPEYGFWEVETSSLRDFPQQFRTFEIVLNNNNTVSIFITNVDPAVQGQSPAAKSRGYAIAADRIMLGDLNDETSHAYNAELIKPLNTGWNTVTAE